MAEDDRDLLEVLKFELSFVEHGGYGRSVHTPWKPPSIFEDSLTCLNFDDPVRTHACRECVLFHLVPEHSRNENIPCHHIPLNEKGGTLATLDKGYNQTELEESIKGWLRATIRRLEREKAEATQ
ncbi:MAG TPA: hypothetical protein VFU27_04005 [Terriglobales bacterium]|nr:hypothetical protein [Terriglobales bacterium]